MYHPRWGYASIIKITRNHILRHFWQKSQNICQFFFRFWQNRDRFRCFLDDELIVIYSKIYLTHQKPFPAKNGKNINILAKILFLDFDNIWIYMYAFRTIHLLEYSKIYLNHKKLFLGHFLAIFDKKNLIILAKCFSDFDKIGIYLYILL